MISKFTGCNGSWTINPAKSYHFDKLSWPTYYTIGKEKNTSYAMPYDTGTHSHANLLYMETGNPKEVDINCMATGGSRKEAIAIQNIRFTSKLCSTKRFFICFSEHDFSTFSIVRKNNVYTHKLNLKNIFLVQFPIFKQPTSVFIHAIVLKFCKGSYLTLFNFSEIVIQIEWTLVFFNKI